jgi:hypothetical protein
LKDGLGEIQSDGAHLVHGRLLEWPATPSLWHTTAAGGVHTIKALGKSRRMGLHRRVHSNHKTLVCGADSWIAGNRMMRVKALGQHGAKLVHKRPRCGAAWKGMREKRPTAIDPGDDDCSARVLSDGRGREHFRGGSILIPAWRLSNHPASLGRERTRNKDDPDCSCGKRRR